MQVCSVGVMHLWQISPSIFNLRSNRSWEWDILATYQSFCNLSQQSDISETKGTFTSFPAVETRGNRERKKSVSWLFQTYQFHVNGWWNVKIFTLPFSHKISLLLTKPPPTKHCCFFSCLIFFIIPSWARIWFLDMIWQITCSTTGNALYSL